MGVDGKIYAELASLCNRNETARAIELANKETQSPVVLLTLLQLAVIAEDVRVLQLLLACASRATCNLNAAISKDGKTLLHIAATKRNLVRRVACGYLQGFSERGQCNSRVLRSQLVTRYLLDAGADLKAKDKKGVRLVDTVTWTDVVYPAVACPLQNAVFKLEQRNEALTKHTEELVDTTRKTRYETENLELENAEVQAHLEASVQYDQSLKDQIKGTKARIEDAEEAIRNQGPRIAYIEEEIKSTKDTITDLVQQVNNTAAATAAFRKESERLRAHHADQLRRLSVAEKRSAVKCEAIETMQRFQSDELLQEKFVRSLTITCQRVTIVKKLAMGGVQARLVDVLLCYGGGNPNIFRHGVSTVTLLISTKAKHADDQVLCTYLKPWPASSLIPTLAESMPALAMKTEDPISLLRVFTDLLHQFQDEPLQSDLTREDFAAVVSVAAQTIATHPVIAASTDVDIKAAMEKLATLKQNE